MDNREKILSEAEKLFASRGYDAVGVQEIVEAAGVTKPTLYHYFSSKQGLLDALLELRGGEMLEEILPAMEYRHDLTRTLEQLAAAYFGFAGRRPVFYRLLLAMWFAPAGSDSFRAAAKLARTQQRLLERLFEEAARDHGNMRERQQAYALTFLGMINTYIGIALNGMAELDGQLVYKAVHQFMHGIYS